MWDIVKKINKSKSVTRRELLYKMNYMHVGGGEARIKQRKITTAASSSRGGGEERKNPRVFYP